MIYLITFLLLLVPVFRFDLMKLKGGERVWMMVEWLMLVLIAGLRYRVGGDTLIYMKMFETMPSLSELQDFDFEGAKYNPLWYIYCAIFKSCGDSFTLMQISNAIIVNTIFFRFFKRYCPLCFFSAVFVYFWGYYCYFNMEILREVLCIAILLEAYPFLEKRRLVPFYLLCCLALCMHMSAAVMFIMPLVLLVRRDRWWMAIIIVVGMVILLKVVDLVSILLFMTFEGSTAETIRRYMQMQEPNMIGAAVNFLIAVPFILLMFMRNKYGYRNNDLMGAMLLFLVGIQTSAMFLPVVYRFSNYFVIFGIVYLLNTFYENYWDIHAHLYAKSMIIATFCIYSFNLTHYYMKSKDEDLPGARMYYIFVPYHSVFEHKSDARRELLLQNMRTDDF